MPIESADSVDIFLGTAFCGEGRRCSCICYSECLCLFAAPWDFSLSQLKVILPRLIFRLSCIPKTLTHLLYPPFPCLCTSFTVHCSPPKVPRRYINSHLFIYTYAFPMLCHQIWLPTCHFFISAAVCSHTSPIGLCRERL